MTEKFKLGDRIRCKVTEMEGITTARIEYLNGCVQYCIKQKMKADGTLPEPQWFDEAYLEKVDDGVSKEIIPAAIGGEQPRSSYPKGM